MIKDLYLAGGCFWGAEHYLQLINGITFTEVGFANGNISNPTYEEVYTDTTGFAETVHLKYDTTIIDLPFLIELFFKAIDPTSLNKQGEDEGTRYRTGIYYTHHEDERIIKDKVLELSKSYDKPICVEVEPLRNFYPADTYHQDYLNKNPNGYCHLPIELFEFAKNANRIK